MTQSGRQQTISGLHVGEGRRQLAIRYTIHIEPIGGRGLTEAEIARPLPRRKDSQ
jgi:hypothetical protein